MPGSVQIICSGLNRSFLEEKKNLISYVLYSQVNRSTALLKSLSAERDRWEKTSETFKNQMSTIAGDCLLSAAFITYAGYFEQQMRQNLFTTWSHHLQQANIQVFPTPVHMSSHF